MVADLCQNVEVHTNETSISTLHCQSAKKKAQKVLTLIQKPFKDRYLKHFPKCISTTFRELDACLLASSRQGCGTSWESCHSESKWLRHSKLTTWKSWSVLYDPLLSPQWHNSGISGASSKVRSREIERSEGVLKVKLSVLKAFSNVRSRLLV